MAMYTSANTHTYAHTQACTHIIFKLDLDSFKALMSIGKELSGPHPKFLKSSAQATPQKHLVGISHLKLGCT